jgi:putative PIN family toxin of toxin-antitoxin system
VKILLDNAILVRANSNTSGLARDLLLRILESEHALLVSNEMLYELARVLRYPRLQSYYGLTESLVFEYISFLRRAAEVVPLNPLLLAPIRDVNDLIVLQTAIIGEAEILCTNDDDFFDIGTVSYLNQLGTEVVTDVTLIHRLRSGRL